MVAIKRVYEDVQNTGSTYDIVLHGNSVDSRGEHILNQVFSLQSKFVVVEYIRESFSLSLDGVAYHVNNLRNWFSSLKAKKILVDITTLDFPEILYIVHWLREVAITSDVDFVYVEPEEYRKEDDLMQEKVSFSLSGERCEFTALPLYAMVLDPSTRKRASLLAFLGFEGSRLGQVIEQDDGSTFDELVGLIGSPAYKPGWENRSINNHIRYLDEYKSHLGYYSCRNPYQVVSMLETLYEKHRTIVVTALGTTPSTLACSLFLVDNFKNNTRQKMVSAIYDFPKMVRERTRGVGCVNLYKIDFS